MIAALLLISGAYAVCGLSPITDLPVTLGIETHGHTIGGMGIVTMGAPGVPDGDAGTSWSLTLLSPGGLSLFTARGTYTADGPDGPTRIETGLDQWRPWLEQLPLGRDLRLAFSTAASGTERCGGGTTHSRPARPRPDSVGVPQVRRRWAGPSGPARAVVYADRVVLRDRLRGYTLTIVAPDRPALLDGSTP